METRKPTVEWAPIEPELQTERGTMPKFTFEWQPGLERNEQTETIARQLLEQAVSYLKKLYGNDYPIPRILLIEITPRIRHAAQGALIRLSRESLAQYERLDEKEKDQEQSLIVHELVHNLRDEEDLSMLAELTYMLEKGHTWRLSNLRTIREEGRLPAGYETGLSTIANWLGIPVDELLNPNEPKNLELMRETFQREVKSIMEETRKK